MASAISKRSQARNERALQELIKTVPGNDRCADCFARNPGWASWSLGVFLCMRCAALHRKLGTHISKVKSLSMDAWSHEQVEQMKKIGNVNSNRLYNPRSVKPNIPIDVDEIDGVLERFVREKYQHRTLADGRAKSGSSTPRHHTGTSASSADDVPPQVPPKSPRFGASLRSTSSQYPIRPSRTTPALPQRQDNDSKLRMLRDMGFQDETKNAQVLKGVSGDVSKAVETLVRLGEGGPAAQSRVHLLNRQRAPTVPNRSESEPKMSSVQTEQQMPTATTSTGYSSAGHSAAASVQESIYQPQPQQQQQQQQQDPSSSSYNPFGNTSQQQPLHPSIEQSFQNMTVSSPLPVMPQNTGSWSNSSSGPYGHQTNPFMKTFTPPMSPNPYQTTSFQQQPVFQSQQQNEINYRHHALQPTNPFLRTSKSQNFAISNPFAQMQQPNHFQQQGYPQQSQPAAFSDDHRGFADSSFLTQQQQQQSPFSQGQYNSNLYSPGYEQSSFAQSPAPLSQPSPSPFDQAFQQQATNTQQQYPQQQFPQQPQVQSLPQQQFQQSQFHQPQQFQQQQQAPLYPQATGRYDKTSILALYNAPHLAPQRLQPLDEDAQTDVQTASDGPPPQANAHPKRSFTAPIAHSQNPFAKLMPNGTPRLANAPNRDSVDFQGLQTGRHSPDAFRSLSARVG